MTDPIALAEASLLWLLLHLLLGWLFAGALALLLPLLAAAPASRALILWLYGLMPPACALALAALTLSPLAGSFLVPSHCHGEECSPHSPVFQLAPALGLAGAGIFMLGLCISLLWLHSSLTRAHTRLQVLTQLGSWQRERAYTRVEADRAFAWCAGLWRARVIVSSALEQALSPEQLSAVLAHEHCHGQRRDNLRRLTLYVATRLWPAGGRQRLLGAFSLATEETCDRFAAECLGQSAALSEALQQLSQQPGTSHQGFCHHHNRTRLEALNNPLAFQPPVAASVLLITLWVAPLLSLPAGLHLLLESL